MTYEASAGASRTITAFYDSRSDAERAIENLVAAGVSRSQVRLVPGQEGGASTTASTTSSYSSENEGGFWDTLRDLFLPEEDRYTYAEGLRRGGYLVTVTTSDGNYDQVLDILDDEGTIDIEDRASSWRSEGWTGYTGSTGTSGVTTGTASTYSDTTTASRASSTSGEEVIPLVEEDIRIGKRDVSHGRVRVRSYVVETPVSEQVSLREESVRVERRPVDRALTSADTAFQDRTIEVEERSEEAVVAKEARVREEIVVNKEVGERTETVSDTVRRTEVEVDDERLSGERVSDERFTTTTTTDRTSGTR